MKKKLAFIVDVRGWAFDIIATHVGQQLSDVHDVKLYYWADFPIASQLLRRLEADGIAHAHFFFREHLKVIFDTVSARSKAASFFNGITVTTHVPDYLYQSTNELIERKPIYDFINGYFVTNADLKQIYDDQAFFAKPDSVIIDWPISHAGLGEAEVAPVEAGRPVNIMWTGNSKWGEYAGYRDYKGLQSIIKPAIERLKREDYPVALTVFDSAEQKRTRETVLSTLAQQDILLVASVAEGTPLTVIEAMSLGVAVVSTPVGIAREVLPAEYQGDAVIERSAEQFYTTLKALMQSPDKLSAMKRANLRAFMQQFSADGPLRQHWLQFLEAAANRAVPVATRQQSYSVNRSRFRQYAINGARTFVFFLKRAGLIRTIDRYFPKAAVWYNRLLHGNSGSMFGAANRAVQYETVKKAYQATLGKHRTDRPLVIYAPMWKGVAASTESLFADGRFRFPYFDDEYPEVMNHPQLDMAIDVLLDTPPRQIIYSGGSVIHVSMARKIREQAPQIRQYFLWHGSPAQWVEPSQLEHFNLWHKLYNTQVIDGMIAIKPDLDKILNVIGVNSFGLINPIPDIDRQLTKPSSTGSDDGRAHIGVFSAVSSWYKNPFVQLLATLGQEEWTLHTNVPRMTFKDLDFRQMGRMECYESMPRPQFLALLASLDLNLYVTNTECSPMVVLESCSLGVPCIVGPAGDIFSGVSDELAGYLVEPRVDDAYAIYTRMKHVLANRAHIQSLLADFVPKYNRQWSGVMDQFYAALAQDAKSAHPAALSDGMRASPTAVVKD